jgi:hypothetical protein
MCFVRGVLCRKDTHVNNLLKILMLYFVLGNTTGTPGANETSKRLSVSLERLGD